MDTVASWHIAPQEHYTKVPEILQSDEYVVYAFLREHLQAFGVWVAEKEL